MTQQLDVADSRDIVARWCALAEQRLEYLTELFETGRWRRFHGERDFLENIQEAKAAVKTWRDLSLGEASRDNTAIDMSWLGRARAALPRGESRRDQIHPRQRGGVLAEQPLGNSLVPLSQSVVDALSTQASPDVTTIAERYPLLRNAL